MEGVRNQGGGHHPSLCPYLGVVHLQRRFCLHLLNEFGGLRLSGKEDSVLSVLSYLLKELLTPLEQILLHGVVRVVGRNFFVDILG